LGYKIAWPPNSKEDLKCIKEYIVANFSTKTANKALNEILDSVEPLALSPEIGINFDKRLGKKLDAEFTTRLLILDRNLIFYLVNEGLQEIYVLRVLNARQDYMRFIAKLEQESQKYVKKWRNQ
jgi:toxin ParE1/3/4